MSSAGPPRSPPEVPFAQHRARVYRHVRKLVRDPGDAEDLTQETLLRAHEQRGTLRDAAALGPWLRAIATNVCTDFLRSRARRAAGGDAPGGAATEPVAAAGSVCGPDAMLDRARMSACGEELLRKLPAGYRRVLVLHDLQGLSSVEIARLLRSTPGAVKIRLHRARRLFRAEIERVCELHVDEDGSLVGGPKPRRR